LQDFRERPLLRTPGSSRRRLKLRNPEPVNVASGEDSGVASPSTVAAGALAEDHERVEQHRTRTAWEHVPGVKGFALGKGIAGEADLPVPGLDVVAEVIPERPLRCSKRCLPLLPGLGLSRNRTPT